MYHVNGQIALERVAELRREALHGALRNAMRQPHPGFRISLASRLRRLADRLEPRPTTQAVRRIS